MMFRLSLYAYHCAVLSIAALFCAGNLNASWQAPLSEQDIAVLGNQAIAQHSTNTRSKANSLYSSLLDVQVLMVELQEKKARQPNDARLAEVFIFDYTTNQANVQLINTATHKLVSTRPINNIHLPLNLQERAFATQLLLNDTNLFDELNKEYLARFGQSLTTLSELDMKVSIWEPAINDTNPADCKQTRCALVSVFTHEHFNFSVEPVVDLKNATVYLDLIQ